MKKRVILGTVITGTLAVAISYALINRDFNNIRIEAKPGE